MKLLAKRLGTETDCPASRLADAGFSWRARGPEGIPGSSRQMGAVALKLELVKDPDNFNLYQEAVNYLQDQLNRVADQPLPGGSDFLYASSNPDFLDPRLNVEDHDLWHTVRLATEGVRQQMINGER